MVNKTVESFSIQYVLYSARIRDGVEGNTGCLKWFEGQTALVNVDCDLGIATKMIQHANKLLKDIPTQRTVIIL